MNQPGGQVFQASATTLPAHRRRAAGLGLTIMALATAASVAGADSATPLDEIVVTATRRPAVVDEISHAVTVVERDAAENLSLTTELLEGEVGAFVQQTTPGQGAVIVRGQRGSGVLHLVDGMRLNNAIFRSAPTQYMALVPLAAVERIELVRGTPASLYGNDAVGGVVNLITRLPRFSSSTRQWRSDVTARVDSAEQARELAAELSAGTEALAAAAAFSVRSTGDRRIGGGERVGPSAYRSRSGRLVVVGTPDDLTRWRIDAQGLEQPSTPRVDELIAGFGQAAPASSEFLFEPNRRWFVHGEWQRRSGPIGLDWDLDLAWQRIDDDRRTRALDSDERLREHNRSDLFGATLTASSAMTAGSWVAGVEFYHDRVSSVRHSESVATGDAMPVTPRFPDGSTVRQASLFAHVTRDVVPAHTLSAGLRHNRTSVDLAAAGGITGGAPGFDDLAGDIGWRWRLGDHWRVTANAGYGFRAPNVFDLGALGDRPGNRFSVPNPDLDAERIRHVDIGLRYRGERSAFELVAFTLDYSDRITALLTGEQTADGRDVVRSDNVTSSRVRGLELGADIEVSPELDLLLRANWTRGDQQDLDEPEQAADRIPPLSGQIGARLTRPSWELSATIGFADDQRRLSDRDRRDPRIDPAGTPGWGVLDVACRWPSLASFDLALGIDNLLDKRFRRHGSGIDAPGRNAWLQLSRRFEW